MANFPPFILMSKSIMAGKEISMMNVVTISQFELSNANFIDKNKL